MAPQVIVVKASQPLWSRCCSCVVFCILAVIGVLVFTYICMEVSLSREKARNKVVVEWLPNPSALWRDPYPTSVPPERMMYYAFWVRLINRTSVTLTVSASAFFLVVDDGHRYRAYDTTSECRPIGPFPYVDLPPGRQVEGNIIVPVEASVPVSRRAALDYELPFLGPNCTIIVRKGVEQTK